MKQFLSIVTDLLPSEISSLLILVCLSTVVGDEKLTSRAVSYTHLDVYKRQALRHYNKTNLKKNRVYTVFVAENVNDILSDLQLADSFFGFETGIETSIMEDDDAGRSYLRGAFLATGTAVSYTHLDVYKRQPLWTVVIISSFLLQLC